MSYMSRVAGALSDFRSKAQPMDANFKELGLRVKTDQWHAARISLMTKMVSVVKDRRIDIDDRVNYMDDFITLIGMPWGRGRSDAIWTQLYNTWQDLISLWKIFESQRHYIEAQIFAEVQELQDAYVETMEDNTLKVSATQVWSPPRTVRAETFLARMEADRALGGTTVRLIGLHKVPMLQDPTMTNDQLFVKENVQETVRLFGDVEMIPRGFKVLNLAFHEKDVTTQSILVVHLQGQPQGGLPNRVDPTSTYGSTRKPSAESTSPVQAT
jgi:hypothetical protein